MYYPIDIIEFAKDRFSIDKTDYGHLYLYSIDSDEIIKFFPSIEELLEFAKRYGLKVEM